MPEISDTDTHLIRSVFDELPSRIFVVDGDVRIQEYNSAAAELLSADRSTILQRPSGDVLNCIHTMDVSTGCGRGPFCKNCVIRNSVTEALDGRRIVRRRTRLEIKQAGSAVEIYALISASPFQFKNKPFVLLVIEDISDLAVVQNMVPICAVCHKIRDEKTAWFRIEAYFKEKWDVDFSHSMCPECAEKEMEKLK